MASRILKLTSSIRALPKAGGLQVRHFVEHIQVANQFLIDFSVFVARVMQFNWNPYTN